MEGAGWERDPAILQSLRDCPIPWHGRSSPGSSTSAPHTKTITLDNMYQPNANWSFANIPAKDWMENLVAIAADTGTEGPNDV